MPHQHKYIVTITHTVTAENDQDAIKKSQHQSALDAIYTVKKIQSKWWRKNHKINQVK